jgi:hypothetical protein
MPLIVLWPMGRRVMRQQTIKRGGSMWRDLAALTFSALLLGAGLMANVTDGPMREHRGSWVTHALR